MAQETPGSAGQPGLSFADAVDLTEPVSTVLAVPLYAVMEVWTYLIQNPPAAVLASAVLASIVAVTSISSQREMTRMRETFATIDRGNWDKDVIDARNHFRRIRNELNDSGQVISRFKNPRSPKDIRDAVTLTTILNHYENLSLGIRQNILDESYLYRWMRSITILDWTTFSPLITAYRSEPGGMNAYIEFEGLATSWQRDRSYRTGRKLKKSQRSIEIR